MALYQKGEIGCRRRVRIILLQFKDKEIISDTGNKGQEVRGREVWNE